MIALVAALALSIDELVWSIDDPTWSYWGAAGTVPAEAIGAGAGVTNRLA